MKTAPGVDRAVSVLTAVSAAAGRGVGLSEIVRRTGFPKATCHSVLASLVEARWLIRHPVGPTYRLGPGLIALGDAASRGFPALPFAADVMVPLCAELNIEGLATARVGAEIAVLAKYGVPAPLSVSVSVGQRLPLVPPLAGIFLAWHEPRDVESVLVGTSAATRRRYVAMLAAVRDRGYAIGLDTPGRRRLGRALAASAGAGRATAADVDALLEALDRDDYQLLTLRPQQVYAVNHVAAPVFDAAGGVTLALTLVGLSGEIRGRDVARIGQRLRSAADEVTAVSQGRIPA